MDDIREQGYGGIIRWSRIRAEMAKGGGDELVSAITKVLDAEAPVCEEHGKLDDPIIGICGETRSLVWACPYCSGPAVRALWEAQGKEANGD